jgi:hypothetical protein
VADCPSCGRPVKQGVRYCLACGAEQPGAGWAPPPAQPQYQPRSPVVVASQPGVATSPPAHLGNGMPWWGVLLIVLVVGLVVAIPMILFVTPFVMVDSWRRELVPFFENQQGLAQESAVKSGVRDVEVGIQTWAADHDGEYPAPGRVTEDRLLGSDGTAYLDSWPTNPYTDLPMDQGTGPGQFTYRVKAKGKDHQLVGYGEAGKVLMTIPPLRPEATSLPLP